MKNRLENRGIWLNGHHRRGHYIFRVYDFPFRIAPTGLVAVSSLGRKALNRMSAI
jgi:hypothetical protein